VFCSYAGIEWLGPLRYTFTGLIDRLPGAGHFSVKSWLSQLGSVALWFGPLCLVWVVAGIVRWREWMRAKTVSMADLLLTAGACWILTASVVGVTFGFPKYHLPGAALLTAASAVILESRIYSWRSGIVTAVIAFLIQVCVLGDGVHVFRYQMRLWQAGQWPEGAGLAVWALIAAGLILFWAVMVLCARKFHAWIAVIIGAALGMNAGLALLQRQSAYDTGYNYGGTGTVAAAVYVQQNVSPGRRIIATDEILYYAGRPGRECVSTSTWSQENSFTAALEDPSTGALVMSITGNSTAQMRRVWHEGMIRDILDSQYRYARIGGYDIWIRGK
jgi:hypothetical protein